MARNEQALRFAVMVGLVLVAAFGALIVRQEGQMQLANLLPADAGSPSPARDRLRERVFALKEAHGRIAALNLSQRAKKAANMTQQFRGQVDSLAGRLGDNMREEPAEPFQPEVKFVDYLQGTCTILFHGWRLTGGRAAYDLEVVYPHQDMTGDRFPKVRKGDVVSGFKLVRESTRGHRGRVYEEEVTSADGKKEILRGRHPDFRTIELSFERLTGRGESYALEIADRPSDREKAALSRFELVESFGWDIPLGRLFVRDDPNNEGRSVTLREGSEFLYSGRTNLVRRIHPDHMEISSKDDLASVSKLPLSDLGAVQTEAGPTGAE